MLVIYANNDPQVGGVGVADREIEEERMLYFSEKTSLCVLLGQYEVYDAGCRSAQLVFVWLCNFLPWEYMLYIVCEWWKDCCKKEIMLNSWFSFYILLLLLIVQLLF